MTQLELRGGPPSIGRLPHPTVGRRSPTTTLAGVCRRLRQRPDGEPAWARPGLVVVMAVAALLFLWDLLANGMSNTYYAAAVKSGSVSWKAWFFGSLDPGSFITVDKPPLSLWLGGLSARVLGFSSFAILLPQALCSLASVGLLHATVKRAFGPAAGLTAAGLLALTPITVAIARVNNPDALLVLLMVGAAYLLLRAVESGRTRFLVWTGVLVGLAFMTKMLQGWMIVPALGATYLFAGPPALGTRVRQLALAGAAMLAASAAWPVAVALWPGSTPYIGGSTDGSVWNLILGYNGFGRITGASEGGGAQGGSFGGTAGLWRMFNDQVGGQIAWLLPLAAVGLIAGLVLTRRAPRTDVGRATLVLLGVWALVHVAIFSTQKGIFHPYYVSALAPAVAGLAGIGVVLLTRAARTSWLAHATLAAAVLGTAYLAVELLGRTADFAPALRIVIPVAAVVAVAASAGLRMSGSRARVLLAVAAVAGAIAITAGPASYSVASVGRSLSGNNVLAGPASVTSLSGMGGGGGNGSAPSGGAPGGTPPSGAPATAQASGTTPQAASGSAAQAAGTATQAAAGSGNGTATQAAAGGGAMGGGSVSAEVISYLKAHQGSAKYLLAASGSQTTADVIIATGEPVVTIGGFNGADPAPTVAELAQLVSEGQVKYVLVSEGGGGGPGGSSTSITTWVKAHGTAVTAVTVSSGTLYEVTA